MRYSTCLSTTIDENTINDLTLKVDEAAESDFLAKMRPSLVQTNLHEGLELIINIEILINSFLKRDKEIEN